MYTLGPILIFMILYFLIGYVLGKLYHKKVAFFVSLALASFTIVSLTQGRIAFADFIDTGISGALIIIPMTSGGLLASYFKNNKK